MKTFWYNYQAQLNNAPMGSYNYDSVFCCTFFEEQIAHVIGSLQTKLNQTKLKK